MSIYNWKFINHDQNSCGWEAYDQTGNLLGKSKETFKSKIDAIHNANLLGFDGGFSDSLKWNIFEDLNQTDKWKWKAEKKNNSTLIAISHKSFDSVKDAFDNAQLFGCPKEYAINQLKNYKQANSNPSTIPSTTMPNSNLNNNSSNNSNNTTEPIPKIKVIPVSAGGLNNSNNINSSRVASSTNSTNSSTHQNTQNKQKDSGGFWKWLVPLLLLLALLLWWLPTAINRSEIAKNNQSVTNISDTSTQALISNNNTNIFSALKLPTLSKLNSAVTASGLENTINNAGVAYLLAPTNLAFDKLPSGTVENLMKPENKTELSNTLKNHLFAGKFDLDALKKEKEIKSIGGAVWPVRFENNQLFVNNTPIDPSIDSASGNISVLEIPTVLVASAQTKSSVITTENIQSKGVSSVSTNVVSNTNSSSAKTATSTPTKTTISTTALEALKKQGNYTILVKAIETADISNLFESDKEYTIFAPTDNAFSKLPPGTVDNLLKSENREQLKNLMKYHVARGKHPFPEFLKGKLVTTLNGQIVQLNIDQTGYGQIKGSKNVSQAPIPDIVDGKFLIHVLPNNILMN
jgi:transforming growth factor-beta-induced protein